MANPEIWSSVNTGTWDKGKHEDEGCEAGAVGVVRFPIRAENADCSCAGVGAFGDHSLSVGARSISLKKKTFRTEVYGLRMQLLTKSISDPIKPVVFSMPSLADTCRDM